MLSGVTARTPPLLTCAEFKRLSFARDTGAATLLCSLDLQRTQTTVEIGPSAWTWNGSRYPYPQRWKERTVYYWSDAGFEPLARYTSSLVKLVPTEWGAPTFEIDGIKMLPTVQMSPYVDAQRKVALIQPRGKVILDTCAGLGYFAAWCLQGNAVQVRSFEMNPDVLWLRSMNPWSPAPSARLTLTQDDAAEAVATLAGDSFDAILHDPPRFALAGNLYSRDFYQHLARVLKRQGSLFHYTGTPNQRSRGRDLPQEVINRLRLSGFTAQREGDGVLAVKN